MSDRTATQTVVVSHPPGLCLRGASAIAQLAHRFQSRIDIAKDGQRVHATDVLQVVSLGAAFGAQLDLEATGPDADEALDALANLFGEDFGLAE